MFGKTPLPTLRRLVTGIVERLNRAEARVGALTQRARWHGRRSSGGMQRKALIRKLVKELRVK